MSDLRKKVYRQSEARAARLRRIANLVPLLQTIKPVAYLLARSWENKLRKNTAGALADPDYYQGLVEYDRKVAALLDPIWEQNYLKLNPSV